MAVLDQHMEGRSGPDWQLIAALSTPGLVLGGLVAYVEIALYLDRFYAELGVSLTEVGLGYSTVLALSLEWIILFAFLWTLVGLFLAIVVTFLRSERYLPLRLLRGWSFAGIFRISIVAAAIMFLAASMFASPLAGAKWARAVSSGLPVIAQPRGPFINLPVRADPATVMSAGKPKESPAIDVLRGRPLIYLGQSSGVAVLYDPSSQSVFRLPLSKVVLRSRTVEEKVQALHSAATSTAYRLYALSLVAVIIALGLMYA